MTLTNTDLVTELYVGYYGRAPDPAGMAFWLGALNSGVSLAHVANDFAASSEYIAVGLAPPTTVPNATALVTTVYQNTLNRAPDAAGQAFWVSELTSGQVTAGGFVLAVESAVNQQTGTNDAITLAAKVTAAEFYLTETGPLTSNPYPPSTADILAGAHAVMVPLVGHTPITPADVTASESASVAWWQA